VSVTIERRKELAIEIERVFVDSHGTYGHRRSTPPWPRRRYGRARTGAPAAVGPAAPSVAGKAGDHRRGSDRGHTAPDQPLCHRDRTWAQLVGDVTSIPTGEGWLHLATVIDCATCKVVGWATPDHQNHRWSVAPSPPPARNIDLTPIQGQHLAESFFAACNRYCQPKSAA
jgi:transposase InsO family protein